MKTFVSLILLLISFTTQSKEYCSEYKSKIESDHQRKESYFTKNNADLALNRLNQAVIGKIKLDWYEYPNLSVSIEGYLLKANLLENDSEHNIEKFCTFVITTAFVD